jgi:sirohydrochlorin ferrochelatase
MLMKGLILIAHGSKKELSNNEFLSLVDNVRSKDIVFDLIDAAFLEFAKPDIKDLVEVFISKNINDVYFYPYFLNSGKHVTIDLPNIINSLKLKYSNINFKLLPHFGLSSNITDIIINDLSSNF